MTQQRFIIKQLDGSHEWYDQSCQPYLWPKYPLPALRTDQYYWRMPSYPTIELIYQWRLTGPGKP